MKIIGITGGTGAGKTTALSALQRLGAYIVDCDAVYHRLLSEDRELVAAILRRFPAASDNGALDRKRLGREVFADPEKLAELSRLTWPFIDREVRRLLDTERKARREVAAVDAAALFESGLADMCDITVFVTAPRDMRLRRIMARDGVTKEYAASRIDAQKPDGFYEKLATAKLVNDFDSESGFGDHCSEYFRKIIGGHTMSEERDKLFYNQKSVYDIIDDAECAKVEEYCKSYMAYLDASRTEREAVDEAIALAEKAGFTAWDGSRALKTGDKVYRSIRGKALILAVVGKKPLSEGTHICAAHIDSPRLDLKQVPLYEDNEVAYFKTHYYGGIRKYQWVTIPLELHGVVALRDGAVKKVRLGAEPGDPVLTISDLLPHLARKQSEQPLSKAIPAENLNIIIGSRPAKKDGDDEKADNRVKLAVLRILNEKYGITEEDFLSAELEAVPCIPVREVGLDRSLIGGYGHDDRVCAYAELKALLDIDTPELTAVCILTDKEEVGSMGVSGMRSQAFECFMQDLCEYQNVPLRRCFERSFCISADVTAAFDPSWPEVSEKRNSAKLNYGLGISKFTGSGGKGGSNDASAEVVARVRRIYADNNVVWQMAELGKVDEGGGGTVALFMGDRNIDTIDAGVPVLSMHAPWEVVSKADCYMTYKGMKAVYEEK